MGRDPACRSGAGRHGGRICRPWIGVGLLDFRNGELRRPSGEGLMADLKFVSSRGGAPAVSLSEAISTGLAPDGGLYIPTRLPVVDAAELAGVSGLPDTARGALAGFFEGDRLEPALGEIADAALDLPAPTTA